MEYVTISPPFLQSARPLNAPDLRRYEKRGSRLIRKFGPTRFSCGIYSCFGDSRSAKANCLSLYYHQIELQNTTGQPTSFVALFKTPEVKTRKEYARLLQQHLQAMYEMDRQYFDVPQFLIRSMDNSEFEFSFGGRLYGVQEFYPLHPKKEFRNDWVMLIYNLKYQGRQLYSPKYHYSNSYY